MPVTQQLLFFLSVKKDGHARTCPHKHSHKSMPASVQTHTDTRGPPVDLIEEIRCYPITSQAISAYIQK